MTTTQVWIQQYQGIYYCIDGFGNIYDPYPLYNNKEASKIIGKWKTTTASSSSYPILFHNDDHKFLNTSYNK